MKELHCREVGFDCEGVVPAGTVYEVLQQVAEHARAAHGLNQLDSAVVSQIQTLIPTVDG